MSIKSSAKPCLVIMQVSLPLVFMLINGCSKQETGKKSGPVIDPEGLVQMLEDGAAEQDVVILDVRDKEAYQKGHVAGAIHVDAEEWKKKSLAEDTGLARKELWRKRIAATGISGREPVVIYGDGKMTTAARIWFILHHLGVPQVNVLNGGYPSLKSLIEEERVAISEEPPATQPAQFNPPEGWSPQIQLADREKVQQAIDSGKIQILDARTSEEYAGKDLRENPRGGYIPTAINVPHEKLLTEEGELKSPDELARIFKKAGLKHGNTIITHCNSGARASLSALAAKRAGFNPVYNYYPGFSDWSEHQGCPVVKPKQQSATQKAE